VLETAYLTWTSATCGDGPPSIGVDLLERVDCDQVEFNECDSNANIWVFRDDEWPYADGGLTLAQTWVHFDTRTGEIFDADVEVNTSEFEITTGNADRRSQFIAIATHEIGHVLGLDHSPDWEATMYASYSRTSDISELTPDDIAGLCAIYPPDRKVGECRLAPYNGFSTACGTVECDNGGCCATTPGRDSRNGAWALALAGLGLALMRARRGRRSPR
jgi:MYXO-CTERM domain-containing protein